MYTTKPYKNSVFVRFCFAGWSSLVAREAHNLKVTGSNPVPARKKLPFLNTLLKGNSQIKRARKMQFANQKGTILFSFYKELRFAKRVDKGNRSNKGTPICYAYLMKFAKRIEINKQVHVKSVRAG